MSRELQTRHVFIDTSYFIGNAYAFRSSIFRKLISLIDSGSATLHLTSVTVGEMEAHIKEDAKTAYEALEKFRTKSSTRMLKHISDPPLNEALSCDLEDISGALLREFEEFREEARANMIPVGGVSVDEVFEQYFSRQPPFGEGKKKAEFPDAFVLAALTRWCEENRERMYVISNDADMISACGEAGPLIHLVGLEEFLQMVLLKDQKRFAAVAEELLGRNMQAVEQGIKSALLETEYYIEDWDLNGEVRQVEIKSFEIEDRYLVDVDADSAKFEFTIEVTFTADVSYDDMDTAAWDYEDKVLIPFEKVDRTVEQTVTLPVAARFIYRKGESEEFDEFEIESLTVNNDDPIAVDVEDDGWPYK
jgi:hypothetical protein